MWTDAHSTLSVPPDTTSSHHAASVFLQTVPCLCLSCCSLFFIYKKINLLSTVCKSKCFSFDSQPCLTQEARLITGSLGGWRILIAAEVISGSFYRPTDDRKQLVNGRSRAIFLTELPFQLHSSVSSSAILWPLAQWCLTNTALIKTACTFYYFFKKKKKKAFKAHLHQVKRKVKRCSMKRTTSKSSHGIAADKCRGMKQQHREWTVCLQAGALTTFTYLTHFLPNSLILFSLDILMQYLQLPHEKCMLLIFIVSCFILHSLWIRKKTVPPPPNHPHGLRRVPLCFI